MRAWTAFFVGAGTIIGAIVIGVAGGLIAGNILNPTSPKPASRMSRLEHSASVKAVAADAAAVPASSGDQAMRASDPVRYLAGADRFGAMSASGQPQSQVADASAAPQSGKEADQQPSSQSSPENANAKVEDKVVEKTDDSDVRRDRRAERHHRRRAERRRHEWRYQNASPAPGWGDVDRSMREGAFARSYAWRPAY